MLSRKLFLPVSIVYGFLSKADRFLKKPQTLDKPIISVGNITWGGTGKTPIVIELLEFIVKQNILPAVLTRGYGRSGKQPLLLKTGAEKTDPSFSGDEPLLIARSVPSADIIVGSDRYNNVLRFKEKINPGVYILDDGFQHWKIKRDLDIVCVNAADPFGNGMLIPAGNLREKPKALKRAGLIIITNSDMVSEAELEKLQKDIFDYSGKNAVVTYYGDYAFRTLDFKYDFDIKQFEGKDVYLLSGVGFAGGVKNSAQKSGIQIKDCFVLRDHKSYNKEMIDGIFEKIGDSYVVITAKDAVKIAFFADERIKEKTAVLTVKPVFKTGREQWEKEILKSLRLS